MTKPANIPEQIAAIEAGYLPRIAAARTAAESRRTAAWIDAPRTLCGIAVRVMTLADYLALAAAENAHLTEHPAPADPAVFWALHDGVLLWRLSGDYRPDVAARDAFIARLRALDRLALHAAIDDYLREIFAERPQHVHTEGDERQVPAAASVSFAACWVHDFGELYGWTDDYTLSRPLPRIFQLRQLQAFDAELRAGRRPAPASDEADQLAAACFADISALQL